MKVPEFLRRWLSLTLALNSPEWGGILLDYANGQWRELHQWNDWAGSDLATDMMVAERDSGRDFVYVTIVKCGENKGYFVVWGPKTLNFHGFWTGLFDKTEAFLRVKSQCRRLADGMGFRNLEEAA